MSAGAGADGDQRGETESPPGANERPGEADADPGLFGKLPRSRPGQRSPRRAAASTRAEAPAATREPEPEPGPQRPPPPRPRAAAEQTRDAGSEHAPAPAPEPPEEGGAGLEELAWAGIAVTAEAATLGVRLVSRAIDAARRATERR
jgi:hypothetical protein